MQPEFERARQGHHVAGRPDLIADLANVVTSTTSGPTSTRRALRHPGRRRDAHSTYRREDISHSIPSRSGSWRWPPLSGSAMLCPTGHAEDAGQLPVDQRCDGSAHRDPSRVATALPRRPHRRGGRNPHHLEPPVPAETGRRSPSSITRGPQLCSSCSGVSPPRSRQTLMPREIMSGHARERDAFRLLRPGEYRGPAGPKGVAQLADHPGPTADRALRRRDRCRILRHRAVPLAAVGAPTPSGDAPRSARELRSQLRCGRDRRTAAGVLRQPIRAHLPCVRPLQRGAVGPRKWAAPSTPAPTPTRSS